MHLAGTSIAGRFTDAHRAAIRDSRIEPTRKLAELAARGSDGPRTFVSASAIGFYGYDRGDVELSEDGTKGDGFLADVVADWEAAVTPAADAGVRTVAVRTGIVQAARGGTLKLLRPLFSAGVGGRLGSGRQWLSWIGIDDLVDVYYRALYDDRLTGPVNAVAPNPVRNTEYTKALAHTLHRPAILPVPSFGPRLLLGSQGVRELAEASQRVRPVGAARGRPPLPAARDRRGAGPPAGPRSALSDGLHEGPDQAVHPLGGTSSSWRVASRNWSAVRSSRAISAPPSPASQSSSSPSSTSGWNCRPIVRPMTKACGALPVLATSTAPRGTVNRSKCHSNHGPRGTRSVRVESSSYQPISGFVERLTEPPSACARSWPPKHTPSIGTPASCASRTIATSEVIHSIPLAPSLTDQREPRGTTAS